MKKIFSKKTLSAFLAAIMVLAMIPMGMISAVAEAVENTDYVLGTNTITINTVEGWKYVSANAAEYADYKVILGEHIDFDGETGYSSLFGATTFTGTFDGNGKKISNFEATTAAAIISNFAEGATVTNVIIEDAYLKNGNAAPQDTLGHYCKGTIFAAVQGTEKTYLNNINVTSVKITNWDSPKIGGLVGSMICTGGIEIEKCNVTASLWFTKDAGGSYSIGGLIGDNRGTTNGVASTSKIKDCFVNVSISNRSLYGYSGGLIGTWGKETKNAEDASIAILNCYVKGEIASRAVGHSAALIGDCRPKGNDNGSVTVSIENIVADVILEQRLTIDADGNYAEGSATNLNNTTCTAEGYMLGYTNGSKAIFTMKNCATTISAESEAIPVAHRNALTDCKEGLTSAQIASLVSYDAEGYVNGVMGSLVGTMKAQVSNVLDDAYIIRFVMPAMTADMTDVKMTISVTSGETQIHTYEIDCTMWDSLTGYNGRTGFTTYTPDQYGAEKLLAGAIVGVPTGTDYDFAITATFTVNGVEITSTTYGASVNAAGELVAE